ncbi:hypothetical protein V6x_61000 [Gimesia chilikensis]|uniref:Uncharacterized protein n=1 Tax=Gimesia chilikensis TaxID=2605989 RepID=A0A517WM65_9PLAN|nr:hypothetical protein V6x_61000 [Gimesia chilikensis]
MRGSLKFSYRPRRLNQTDQAAKFTGFGNYVKTML